MSNNNRTNRQSLKTTVTRTPSTHQHHSVNVIKTPPQSAPVVRTRYSTSRLDRLATPRSYSSWKKPIKSKFHRRHTQPSFPSSGDCSWDEVVSRNNKLTMGQTEIEAVLGKLHDRIQDQSRTWRQELSPKINKLLSSITLSNSQTGDREGEMKTQEFLNRERDDWDASYSTTNNSDCDESLYHECSGDYSQTELSSEQKLEELTTLLLSREQAILELKAKLKEKDDAIKDLRRRHELERKVECRTSSPTVEPSDQLFSETNQHDTSIDSTRSNQGSFNDFVLTLSEELDSKLSEIDQMKLDHQMQIDLIHDSYESELFTKEEQIAAMATTSTSRTNQTDTKGIINVPQVEMLVTALKKLKEEQESLRQALHLGNDAFHAALDQNCNSIMNYIGEELDSLHANELRSHNEALQYELEATRWENAELKAELQRMNDERYNVNDVNETKQSDFDSSSTTPR